MLKPFVVVVPSFNNERWCRQNLESVLRQDYPSFRVIYVDDASTDATGRIVAETLETSGAARQKITFVQNEYRRGAAENIDRAVRSCTPDEIVVLVDGDDFLAHRQVLARLNTVYQDPDIWVTWGQFERFPQGGKGFCASIPDEIVSANAFRDYPFVASHLRTFYAGLYQRIRPIDLQDRDRRFFATAGDVAHMFALLEMAGHRARFVAEVLYLYNRENPINDDKVDRSAQLRTEMEIRAQVRYGRVANLSGTTSPSEIVASTGIGRSLFENSGLETDSDGRRRPFRMLRSVLNRLGYTVRETQTLENSEDAHLLTVFDVRPREVEMLAAQASDAAILFLWSDPISAPLNSDRRYHEAFRRIYTWHSDLVDDVRYFQLRFPFLRPMIDDVVPFEKRKLCTLIASKRDSQHPDELYSEERRVAEYFAAVEADSFDLFGWGWSRQLDRNFRGFLPRRLERLRRYKFSFCYETVRGWNGFITAKIFDSFAAGCIPIYWGAPDVAASIPADCFIAREDFHSEADLHAFLRDMSPGVHQQYLDNIRAFLLSEGAVPYSVEHFVRTFVGLVGGRAGQRTADRATAFDAGAANEPAWVSAVGAAT